MTVSWDANTESDLAGYKVHYGISSRVYTQSINAGNVTTRVVSGLSAGITYYFAVTAYDTSGNESGYSAEVSKTIASAPDTTPPVLSAIAAGSITSSGAVITWTTNEPATSQVEYGTTTVYGATTPLGSSLVTSHSRTLSGLQA
ncbi:MAG: fibronectin type III domain-containing protein, partial [Nitrospirota bacterium]